MNVRKWSRFFRVGADDDTYQLVREVILVCAALGRIPRGDLTLVHFKIEQQNAARPAGRFERRYRDSRSDALGDLHREDALADAGVGEDKLPVRSPAKMDRTADAAATLQRRPSDNY